MKMARQGSPRFKGALLALHAEENPTYASKEAGNLEVHTLHIPIAMLALCPAYFFSWEYKKVLYFDNRMLPKS